MAISTFPTPSAGGGGRTAKAYKASARGGTFSISISAGVYEVSGQANFPVTIGNNVLSDNSKILVLENNESSITLSPLISNWTDVSFDDNFFARNGTFRNDTFVLVGRSDELFFSSDGKRFIRSFLSQLKQSTGIDYSPNLDLWVVAGVESGSEGKIKSSPDLENWTDRFSGTLELYEVLFANNEFFIGTDQSYFKVSSDGINWSNRTIPGNPSSNRYLADNGSLIVSVGGQFDEAISSTDGTTWTLVALPTDDDILDIAFGNGIFLAVGKNGVVITSTDGQSWTEQTSPTNEDIDSVQYSDVAGFLFVTVFTVHQTDDGITFSSFSLPVEANTVLASPDSYLVAGPRTAAISAQAAPQALILTDTTLEELE